MPRFANPDEKPVDYSTMQLIADTWRRLAPYRGRFFAATFFRLISDLVWLYPSYGLASLINILSRAGHDPVLAAHQAWLVVWLWSGAVVIRFSSMFLARTIGLSVAARVNVDTEVAALRHLFKIDIDWHEKENSGNKIKRIQSGAGNFERVITIWFMNVIEICVNFVGMTFIIAKFNLLTGGIMLAFAATYFALSRFMTPWAARSSYAVNAQEEVMTGLEFQAVNNIRTVKVLGMGSSLMTTLAAQGEELFAKIKQRVLRFQTRANILPVWAHVVRTLAIIYVISGILHGRLELGFLFLFSSYFSLIWQSIAELSDVSQDIVIARYTIVRMNHILSVPATIEDDTGKEVFPQKWQTLHIENLNFSYGDNTVLQNMSLEVKRGEKIGVVGLSGAGKSTLFKLLLKEYESFTGAITFDSTPIQHIKKSDYFNHVAVVLQDTEVFNFSLKDNVTVANDAEKDNEELLQRSLDIAHVTDFLHKLPHGTDTVIGEKGVKLSGGEKQRLGIARAIFKQPQLLLLDEATSHLDLESEEKIKDSLHTFFENVTAIVIAHRLTTIKAMDKIIVIENGQLVEQGNFDELYKKQGRFFELWEKQKL
jgi:ABC-type multidrug transport system fused ATPase/permease subunit